MVKERIELLATELESDNWQQAKGQLRLTEGNGDPADDDEVVGHCCLGVACEVYLRETGHTGTWDNRSGWLSFVGEPGMDDAGYLPTVVADWFGIDMRLAQWMVDWNDGDSLDFPMIAANLRERNA